MEKCRIELVIDETETDDESLIGEMCHLVAESDDGPRGNSPLSPTQRNLYDNLILLCRNHHGEIDGQPNSFPVDMLKSIKKAHETWVRSFVPEYDPVRQRNDEIYATYIDGWATEADLNGWKGWSSFILGGGQPEMTIVRADQLDALRSWLLSRVWPGTHVSLEAAFLNFRLVLGDFMNVFREHADKPSVDADCLLTRKFYQIPEWNPALYKTLANQFNFHVDLVNDLMLELTRAANLVCDQIRATVLPSFRLKEGRLAVLSGPHLPDGAFREVVEQYRADELSSLQPYPGLSTFKTIRSTRNRYFGNGNGP